MSLLFLLLFASHIHLFLCLHQLGGSLERKNGNLIGNAEYTYKNKDFSISGSVNNRKQVSLKINYDY